MRSLRSVGLATAIVALPVQAVGQVGSAPQVAQPAPSAVQVPVKASPSAQAPAADPIAPLPPEGAAPVVEDLPPPIWAVADAQDLLAFIIGIGGEGLDPRDYDPAGLSAAIQSGDSEPFHRFR